MQQDDRLITFCSKKRMQIMSQMLQQLSFNGTLNLSLYAVHQGDLASFLCTAAQKMPKLWLQMILSCINTDTLFIWNKVEMLISAEANIKLCIFELKSLDSPKICSIVLVFLINVFLDSKHTDYLIGRRRLFAVASMSCRMISLFSGHFFPVLAYT